MSTERWGARGTLYRESVVIDGLNVSNWDSEAVFRDLAAGTVTAINATCATWEGFAATVDAIARWRRRLRERSDTIRPALSAEDIRRAKREGRTGIILGFQNASPIENDLDRLEVFAALGVRVIQLTFHERNLLGNGCYERHDDGVSNFGRDAIAEMNRLGIVIDLSHVGDRTTLETIEASAAPVAITHANCREYHRIPRNKTDQAIRAVAAKGGVIGATCYTKFLRTGGHSTVEDSWMPLTIWWSAWVWTTLRSAPTSPRISRPSSGGTSVPSRALSTLPRSTTAAGTGRRCNSRPRASRAPLNCQTWQLPCLGVAIQMTIRARSWGQLAPVVRASAAVRKFTPPVAQTWQPGSRAMPQHLMARSDPGARRRVPAPEHVPPRRTLLLQHCRTAPDRCAWRGTRCR